VKERAVLPKHCDVHLFHTVHKYRCCKTLLIYSLLAQIYEVPHNANVGIGVLSSTEYKNILIHSTLDYPGYWWGCKSRLIENPYKFY
jgi:hypothetical protein